MLVENTSEIRIIVPEIKQIDVNNYSTFSNDLNRQLEGQKKVILDLKNVNFMDSTGLGTIVSALRSMNESRGELILCHTTQAVNLLFDMVRLSQIAKICKDREEAIRNLQ